MPDLHLHHVTAVTLDAHDTVVADAAIRIADARIVYVGPMAGAPPPRAGDTVLDLPGRVAIPGLINAHTHLGMTLFRGVIDDLPLPAWLARVWAVEARLTREDVYWASLLGMAEMLRGGVTTFNDMYWHMEAVADAVRETGMRACLCCSVLGMVPDSLETALARVRTLRAEGHPRITPLLGPHAPYTVPRAMLRRIVEAAAAMGVGVHTHVAETLGEVQESVSQFGKTPLAYLHDIGLLTVPFSAAHGVHLTAQEITVLAEAGAAVVHCPTSNMKLGAGIAPVPALLEAGVTVGLGTDGAGSNNTLDVLRELRLAALLHKAQGDPTAITAPRALALATRGGAAALGVPDIGVLEVGKRADIAVLDFERSHLTPRGRVVSHLVYAADAADVETVIVDGALVMHDRRLLTIDEARVRAKVNEAAQRLFRQ